MKKINSLMIGFLALCYFIPHLARATDGALVFEGCPSAIFRGYSSGAGDNLNIQGPTKDGPKHILIKGYANDPNKKGPVEFCEKGAILSLTNKEKYKFSIAYTTNDVMGIIVVDLSSGGMISCVLEPK